MRYTGCKFKFLKIYMEMRYHVKYTTDGKSNIKVLSVIFFLFCHQSGLKNSQVTPHFLRRYEINTLNLTNSGHKLYYYKLQARTP